MGTRSKTTHRRTGVGVGAGATSATAAKTKDGDSDGDEDDFFGYELRVEVTSENNAIYQDGSHVQEDKSVELYHSTRQGLLHNIFRFGVRATIPSHKTQGLWAFSVPTLEGYAWGRTGIETLYGCKLELQAPLTFWNGSTAVLHHNRRIAGDGDFGHLRWVVRGNPHSSLLPCRVKAVRFLLPSQQLLDYTLQLRISIKNCVNWSFGCTWQNDKVEAVHVPYKEGVKKLVTSRACFDKECDNKLCRNIKKKFDEYSPQTIGQKLKKTMCHLQGLQGSFGRDVPS